MRRMFAVLWVISCAYASLAFAQSSGKSYLSQRLVHLSVVASDAKGDPVVDLRAADVQVREDGQPRPVVFFRFNGSNRSISPLRPGEFINRPAPPPTLILVDRWNARLLTLASAWHDVSAAFAQMESFDRVYVYFLTGRGELVPVNPLPPPDADLRVPAPATAAELVAKVNDAVRSFEGFRDIDARDPVLRVKTTCDALSMLWRGALMAGRKNLIWVTHGFPLTATLLTGERGDFTVPVQDLAQTVARSQIAIYTVDQSEKGAGEDPAGLGRQTLEMFSALTGGRLYTSGRIDEAIARAMADARGSYRLAYDSPVRENGRKEHKIRLNSVRKGVRLLTREAYFGDEPDPEPDQPAAAAFSSQGHCPFDATEIALRVAMSRSAATALHFDIHVDPADVLIHRLGERFEGGLNVMLALYSNGIFQGASFPIQKDLNLTQEEFDSASKDGILITQDLTVNNQIQQVRVMVFDRALHRMGS
ncbi:MAG: VWA domain-containing protein, partial [Candidatus Solibacter sp.]